MIAQDQDTRLLDLGRQMAIAEMPGQFDQMQRVFRADLEEFLRGGNNLDQITILKLQPITACKQNGIFEVEHDAAAIFKRQKLAAQVTLIMGQNNPAGDGPVIGSGRNIG